MGKHSAQIVILNETHCSFGNGFVRYADVGDRDFSADLRAEPQIVTALSALERDRFLCDNASARDFSRIRVQARGYIAAYDSTPPPTVVVDSPDQLFGYRVRLSVKAYAKQAVHPNLRLGQIFEAGNVPERKDLVLGKVSVVNCVLALRFIDR